MLNYAGKNEKRNYLFSEGDVFCPCAIINFSEININESS
jgi:hypothetical protein